VPRTYPETIATKPLRPVPLAYPHAAARHRQGERRQGGFPQRRHQCEPVPAGDRVDADTLIEPDALLRLTRPFLLAPDPAVGGTVRVANGCTVKDGRVTDARVPGRFLPGVQVVEYLRAFRSGGSAGNRLGAPWSFPPHSAVPQEYLHAIGGYATASVVEDLDLVVRLAPLSAAATNGTTRSPSFRTRCVDRGPRIRADPVAPAERWHRGLIAAMWQYKGMLSTLGTAAWD